MTGRRGWRIGLALLGLALSGIGLMADEAGIEVKNPAIEESPAGNLVADALRQAAGADIAFFPAAELKEGSQGRILPARLSVSCSYPEDPVAVVTLTGTQVLQALERSVSLYPKKNRGFLQVSGLQLTFDPSRPSGERIVSVKVGKENLKAESKYRVAMSGTLAGGSLGYFKVWDKKQAAETLKATVTVQEAIASFLKEGKGRSPDTERIRAKKT